MSRSPLTTPLDKSLHAAWWGKLPSQGDFVGRRMPHALMLKWDSWLRDGIDFLRDDAGASWASRFVKSPIWYFACPASVLGTAGVGVFGPSVDRIGRLFPLIVMATVEGFDVAASDEEVLNYLTGLRQVLIDARRLPLSAQQVDEYLASLAPPIAEPTRSQDQALIHDLLSDLLPPATPSSCVSGLQIRWRECITKTSQTSVWWTGSTDGHPHGEVVHGQALDRRLFARLFKGQHTATGLSHA